MPIRIGGVHASTRFRHRRMRPSVLTKLNIYPHGSYTCTNKQHLFCTFLWRFTPSAYECLSLRYCYSIKITQTTSMSTNIRTLPFSSNLVKTVNIQVFRIIENITTQYYIFREHSTARKALIPIPIKQITN